MVLVSILRAVSVFCRQAALTDKTSQYFGTTPPASDSRDHISALICRTVASGIPTAVRIFVTQFLSFQQNLAWQSTRVLSCVTLCPGGATPLVDWNLTSVTWKPITHQACLGNNLISVPDYRPSHSRWFLFHMYCRKVFESGTCYVSHYRKADQSRAMAETAFCQLTHRHKCC